MILTLDQKNTLLSEDIIQTFIKELNKKYAEKSEESEKSGESSESEESEKSEESTSYSEQLKTWRQKRKNKTKEKRDEEDIIFNFVKNEAFEFYKTKFEYNISNHSNEVISIINFELSTQGTKTVEQIIQIIQNVKDYIDSMYSNREYHNKVNSIKQAITKHVNAKKLNDDNLLTYIDMMVHTQFNRKRNDIDNREKIISELTKMVNKIISQSNVEAHAQGFNEAWKKQKKVEANQKKALKKQKKHKQKQT
jgi:hypothetical protein